LICIASTGKINYRRLQKRLLLTNQLRYRATIFAIVLTMNKGMDYWIIFFFIHPSSLHLKMKFMKKNLLRRIMLTWRKQVPITYESLGLVQRNKDFRTSLEQANKMMSRFLLFRTSFTKKETFKIYRTFQQYANSNVFNALYCKFMLVRLCPVFADPVTFYRHHSWLIQSIC